MGIGRVIHAVLVMQNKGRQSIGTGLKTSFKALLEYERFSSPAIDMFLRL
jgi:hypothetical protein